MTIDRADKWLGGLLFALALALAWGCATPLERTAEEELRETMRATNAAYLKEIASSAQVETPREKSTIETDMTPKERAELDKMSGPEAYADQELDLGPDLMGNAKTLKVSMTLERAIRLAVEHNLELRQARLLPAISETQVTQAQAAFDPIAFVNLDYQNLDTPKPATPSNLVAFGTNISHTTALTTGIRQTLITGGEIKAQTEIDRNFNNPSFFSTSASRPAVGYSAANVLVGLTQPLLRNFGTDVVRAQVLLARSGRGQSVQDLRKQILEVTVNAEKSYWDLVFTQSRLLIQLRLLERTVEDYRRLRARKGHDVSAVRLTEAQSFVEIRRTEVVRARQDVRQASDALKRIINAPDLPLSGEALIVPLDKPVDMPVQHNLLDAVTTALRRRPELQRAILEIHDASIRLRVADNARLPQLNLSAAIRYNGVGTNTADAYNTVTDAQYIDYLVGAQFEMPLGDRGPEALYRQRQLERQALTFNYRRAAQEVLVDVKNALRQVDASYQTIGGFRATRVALSDNLRALDAEDRIGSALTPEFLLDQKLTAQQRLADAEVQEIKALTDYNTSIAKLHQAMGTLLDRNNIEFEDQPVREDWDK